MAYIFDPLRNTFIDDEDTSLGNKLALVDNEEIDKVIKQIDDKFGPGTVFPASELPENKPAEVEQTEQFNRFNRMYEDGGRVNLAAAIPLAPMAIAPLAKAFGITTTGLGVMEASNKIANYLKENPSVMNTPEFRAIALTFGLNIPGVIAPDADEMEREAEKIREMTKPTGFPAETEKMPIKTGETTPPKIDTKESFPAELEKLPFREEFPRETQQLPIIFENKKVENVKKKFDKVIELYETTGPGGPKRAKQIDQIRNKKFADDVKNLIDNEYGGNAQALANDLKIERVRINSLLNKHGIKQERAGNKTIQNIFLKQDKDKLSVSDLTTNIKGNETYLIDRTKQRFSSYDKDKNKFLNYRDIAEIVGVNLPDKTAQDFFQSKLRSANKKIGIETKKGFGKEILYNLEDTINALTKTNIAKPVKGTGSVYSQDRVAFEKKIDNAGFGARTYILEQIRDASKEVLGEETVARAGEQYGHAEALSNLKRYSKLFKNSNAADITTLVFQDPILNVDVLQAYGSTKTGIEQKRQPFLNILEKLIGKKATAENIQIANEALNGLNELNNEARIQIKRFQKTNRFVRDQENRIPDYELTLPKEGETFKSGFLNIDMSSIDPSVSVGRILEINPDAKTFSDLSKEEQNLYRENLRNQITDFLKYFYQESGVNREDILSLEEEILEKNLKSKVAAATGGPIELSPMPRAEFGNGGAAGADDEFAKQLEYFFLNPDAELPAAQTFRETMNPIEIVNDMIDPRNFPYYADRLVESGIRIGEFGARVLPAVGKLAADLIQKPAFKIKPASGQGYVQDYTDIPPSNITGTGIFSEFLNNLVGSEGTKAITEKTGLAKLIKDEEQKMKDERKTAGAKILADQVTLGMELTAPIFPGLKLLKAYAKNRNLPVDKTTREIMDKEIDEVLTQRGISRRDFMKVAGAGGAVAIAKLLGIGDDLATVTKVAEKAAPIKPVVPNYFFTLADKIKKLGTDNTKGLATVDREAVYVYKDYELYEDLTTGNIRINKKSGDPDGFGYYEEEMVYTKGIGDESTKGTPPDEYEEFTVKADMDGKMKDVEVGLEDLDDLIDELGAENISLKDLEAMGYEADMLPISVQKKLGLKETSPAKKMLKRQGVIENVDDDLPDLPF